MPAPFQVLIIRLVLFIGNAQMKQYERVSVSLRVNLLGHTLKSLT